MTDQPTMPTTVAEELAAMRHIVTRLDKLDPAAQDRVVGWLWDRYRARVDEEDPA